MFQSVTIAGYLGNEPETREVGDTEVTTFSVGAKYRWSKEEKTEWFRVVTWGGLSEVCSRYLSKGRPVLVQGFLRTQKWEDDKGVTRYSTELQANTVKFLGSGKGDDQGESNNGGRKRRTRRSNR